VKLINKVEEEEQGINQNSFKQAKKKSLSKGQRRKLK